MARLLVEIWEFVGFVFLCVGSLLRSIFNVLGTCRAHLGGPGQFQATNLGASWEAFGSDLGVILVLCCKLLGTCLGCQIHPY